MQFQGSILNNFRQVNIKKASYLYLLDGRNKNKAGKMVYNATPPAVLWFNLKSYSDCFHSQL